MIPPDRNADFLTLVSNKRRLDWEVEREPAVHSRGVRRWIDRVEDILVQLCGEITRKAVDFAGNGFHGE